MIRKNSYLTIVPEETVKQRRKIIKRKSLNKEKERKDIRKENRIINKISKIKYINRKTKEI